MSEQLKEALSAIVDGEASEFELRRVLDEMGKDEGLVRAWQSYHLIRQAAQGENVQGVADMGDRIWASLDADEFLEQDIVQEEPPVATVANPPRRRWGMVGGAIAAALALGVFVTSDYNPTEETPAEVPSIAQTVLDTPVDLPAIDPLAAEGIGGGLRTVAATSADLSGDDEFDYGPGFVPYSEMSPADQARSDGYFLHHVQHQAVNNDNVLSFVKMISYPQ